MCVDIYIIQVLKIRFDSTYYMSCRIENISYWNIYINCLVTGIKATETDGTSLDKIKVPENHEMHIDSSQDNCPLSWSWVRSPEKILAQETYLALATGFVILRLFYLLHPTLLLCAQYAWRRHIRNVKLWILLERPMALLEKIIQLFSFLKEPCKQRNLQGGAINARAWASRSLATVSIGEPTPNTGIEWFFLPITVILGKGYYLTFLKDLAPSCNFLFFLLHHCQCLKCALT